MASGVNRLRAMFEQRVESTGTSPPDRGRSPAVSSIGNGTPTPSLSPRPLSKVRTNFVAVEKDGRIGLKRDPSENPISPSVTATSQRLINETGSSTPGVNPYKEEAIKESLFKNTAAFKENQAIEPPSAQSPAKDKLNPAMLSSPVKGPATPQVAPNMNPDKITDEEDDNAQLTPADPTSKAALAGDQIPLSVSSFKKTKEERNDEVDTKGNEKADAKTHEKAGSKTDEKVRDKTHGKANGQANGVSGPKEKSRIAVASKPAPKPTPVSHEKTVSKPLKSPASIKPTKRSVAELAKPKTYAPEKKESAIPKAAQTASKPPAANAAKKTGKPGLLPSVGIARPKPRSPTRPVKLPSSILAPTASFASKTGIAAPNGKQSAAGPRALSRSSSVGPVSKIVTRQASTSNRGRPSIGPPPKPAPRDNAMTKKEVKEVDEGFLARMMRPTQSSSSKAAEKAPITPPRKPNTASPVASGKRPISNDATENAKKATIKLAETTKAKGSLFGGKKTSATPTTATEVAPVAAQLATAEEVIEVAKASGETATVTATATTPMSKSSEAGAIENPAVHETSTQQSQEMHASLSQIDGQDDGRVNGQVKGEADEQVEETQRVTTPVPVVTADALKVVDIEEVVRDADQPADQPADPPADQPAGGDAKDAAQANGPADTASAASDDTKVDMNEAKTEIAEAKSETT